MTAPNRQPVIVGVDGSPASFGAVRWAADEAIRRGEPLRIVHALHVQGSFEEIADEHGLARSRRMHVRRGSPVPVLLEEAQDALMVVLGACGQGGFEGLRLGAVTQQVLEHAATPVLVARHD